MKKNFLTLSDLSGDEIEEIFELSREIKERSLKGGSFHPLLGKSLALLFEKPSLRTRVVCELGMRQLGGEVVYLGPQEVGLGQRESVEDCGRVLSGYFNGIVTRTYSHNTLLRLANSASVPVINGLSDLYHPCQVLSDLFTIKEKFGRLEGLKLAFIGDGNNVCHSLIIGSSIMGMEIRVAAPKGYWPKQDIIKEKGAIITPSPEKAVKGVDIIYTDTWISMGQEKEAGKRRKAFRSYQVNTKILNLAKREAVVMHCLPARRGEEITDDVIDGKHSLIFDQAQNRLHTQKAIFTFFL